MSKMFRRVILVMGVFFLVVLTWIFRPYSSPNSEDVYLKLSELEEPFQTIERAYYLDGGSVGVRIVDSRGEEAIFSLRAELEGRERLYRRLYSGALHHTDASATEIPFSSDTVARLLEILRDSKEIEHDRDIAIASVSGRWRDYSRIFWRKFVSREY